MEISSGIWFKQQLEGANININNEGNTIEITGLTNLVNNILHKIKLTKDDNEDNIFLTMYV